MVLEIAGKLFGQGDVRETASGSAEQSNYNTSDFEVISDIVNLKNKTSYYSVSPADFIPSYPDVNDVSIIHNYIKTNVDVVGFYAAIRLPHGAVITEIIVYGNAGASAETWYLYRVDHSGNSTEMATANIGTADSSITNGTINNEDYSYTLWTTTLDTNDTIYGARIKYTTDYD